MIVKVKPPIPKYFDTVDHYKKYKIKFNIMMFDEMDTYQIHMNKFVYYDWSQQKAIVRTEKLYYINVCVIPMNIMF